MFIRKFYIVIGLVLALGFFFEIVAHAEVASQEVPAIRWSAPLASPNATK